MSEKNKYSVLKIAGPILGALLLYVFYIGATQEEHKAQPVISSRGDEPENTKRWSSPLTGDITVINGGAGYLAVDSRAFDRMMDLAIAKDDIGLREMIFQGRIIATPKGTKVRVIDAGIMTSEIRLLSGPHSGKTCIIQPEFLKKTFR